MAKIRIDGAPVEPSKSHGFIKFTTAINPWAAQHEVWIEARQITEVEDLPGMPGNSKLHVDGTEDQLVVGTAAENVERVAAFLKS